MSANQIHFVSALALKTTVFEMAQIQRGVLLFFDRLYIQRT